MRFPRVSPRKYRIRKARLEDLDQLESVEKASWEAACDPQDMFTKGQFQRHIEEVGDYIFVAEERSTGRLLGYASALRVDIPLDEIEEQVTTWYSLTEDGWYSNHAPDGQTIFGGSLGVLPECQRSGIGDRLVEAEFVKCVRLGLEYGFLGGRLPGMAEYLANYPGSSPEKYFELKRDDGKPYDPELRFYAADFEIRKLLPGYFKDKESCDHGVLLVWRNPFYQIKRLPPFVAVKVFKAVLVYYHVQGWWQRRKA
jgi:ribosomal protein S18 acetylase RimI-like enzyme